MVVQQKQCIACHRTCTLPPEEEHCPYCRPITRSLVEQPAIVTSFWTTWGHILLGLLLLCLPALLLYAAYLVGYGQGYDAAVKKIGMPLPWRPPFDQK